LVFVGERAGGTLQNKRKSQNFAARFGFVSAGNFRANGV
jgi:hypothetical protein